ncbi:hypothetical protein AMAG_11222 [Allomyces macrogynus ATCC 38327]|uniref:SH3 domain-containing protein n=1 Tax=Allomyces macrogynus (strain ATCC 38327) TaxID=578462 RepID=A0A0L0SWK4_ALLM3|nr:hypothetical protein AMAG_11222 [Allomyces macrogynus ATCC 38327]|eukprot:KNE66724.1 hypothetical protein AMAG_11222 [Allomyces macrogynus ATCC 38327]
MAASTIPTAFAKAKCSAEGLPEPDLLIRNSLKQPVCGNLNPNSTCLVGQCCSSSGFCGPIPETNGVFVEGGKEMTKAEATALYCTDKSQGDWRNWQSAGLCADTGVRYPAGPDAPPLVVPRKATASATATSTTAARSTSGSTMTGTTTLSSTAMAGSTSDPSPLPVPVEIEPTGLAIGAVIGIVIGVLVAAALFWFLFVSMRRKRQQKLLQDGDDPLPVTDRLNGHHGLQRVPIGKAGDEDRVALNPRTGPASHALPVSQFSPDFAPAGSMNLHSMPPASAAGFSSPHPITRNQYLLGGSSAALPKSGPDNPSVLYLPSTPTVPLVSPIPPQPSTLTLQLPAATLPLQPEPVNQTRPKPVPMPQLPPPPAIDDLENFTRLLHAGATVAGPRRCIRAVVASHSDELDLSVGDMVEVLRMFSDGWAMGKVVEGVVHEEGFFPLAVLEAQQGDDVLLALRADLSGAASPIAASPAVAGKSAGLKRSASLVKPKWAGGVS